MKKTFYTLLFSILLFSCAQHKKEKDKGMVKEGNTSITLLSDTAQLSKLIDMSTYRPTHVQFQYTSIDNSGKNERLTVPGPSDSYLQAVLYFDAATFRKFQAIYFNVDYLSPNYNKQEFNFNWLDSATRKELLQSDTNYHGHPDYFLGSGQKGKLWFLHNKVLLIKNTN